MLKRLWCRLFHRRRWRFFMDGHYEGSVLVNRVGFCCWKCWTWHVRSETRTQTTQTFWFSKLSDPTDFAPAQPIPNPDAPGQP